MSCCQMIKFSLSKLVMEFTGTLILTMFFCISSVGPQAILLLGLWITNIFFWKISGSHFNPAVTFAFIFRRDERKMHWKLAIAYIVAQLAGGYVGALLQNFYTLDMPELSFNGGFFLRALCQELLVSFFYVFFFMSNTDEKLLFSNEKAINCFILACSYVGARAIFYGNSTVATLNYGAVANPAIAIGICMSTLFNEGFGAWNSIYLYPTIPFGGAILAVFFYELVYKKTQAFLAHEDGDSNVSDSRDDSMGEHD